MVSTTSRWVSCIVACTVTTTIACLSAVAGAPAAGDDTAQWPGYTVSIEPALKSQTDVIARREHCSIDADRLGTLGVAVGQQVRIYRDRTEFALFTIVEAHDEKPDTIVRLGRLGRARLGPPGPIAGGRVVAMGPHPTLDDREARRRGELVERALDDGKATGLLILAPHGGDIEPYTDTQAEHVAQALAAKGKGKRVAAWRCKGFDPPGSQTARSRWHITSTDIHDASFPKLGRLAMRRFDHALSFHGMARDAVLIGGAGPGELKETLRAEIAAALEGSEIPVVIARPGEDNGGESGANIVNRYCNKTGIQIEQSNRARRQYWKQIADAVARVYLGRL